MSETFSLREAVERNHSKVDPDHRALLDNLRDATNHMQLAKEAAARIGDSQLARIATAMEGAHGEVYSLFIGACQELTAIAASHDKSHH